MYGAMTFSELTPVGPPWRPTTKPLVKIISVVDGRVAEPITGLETWFLIDFGDDSELGRRFKSSFCFLFNGDDLYARVKLVSIFPDTYEVIIEDDERTRLKRDIRETLCEAAEDFVEGR
jgi:hypothetical protein